jgi:glutathione S-transferase
MTITLTTFERSPDGGKGLARDTRVRWALEEVGQPYEVCPVSFRAMKETGHLALRPFGHIPTYEEGELDSGRRCGRSASRRHLLFE